MNALTVNLENHKGIPLDVSLHCNPGEVLALVGPSGTGKSTVLRSVAGLLQTDQGFIECGGQVWFDSDRGIFTPPQKRRVGMVFQNYALFPHLTVRQNIEISRDKNSSVNVSELLVTVNLSDLDDRMPSTLSGGQQQRVALARALAREPEVLLLDEPFSAVDQVTRRKLRLELLQLVRKLDIPILLVTHDLDEAAMLCNSMCVLHNGSSLQTGTAESVFSAPVSATVARLMDFKNLFSGKVVDLNETDNSTTIEWAGLQLEAPFQTIFVKGTQINWCIPADQVLLHRRVNPSNGVRENPVYGQVIELVTIGGISNIIIALETNPDIKLHMDLPPHVVGRNELKVGDQIGVSLLKNSIHLMDYSHSNSR